MFEHEDDEGFFYFESSDLECLSKNYSTLYSVTVLPLAA